MTSARSRRHADISALFIGITALLALASHAGDGNARDAPANAGVDAITAASALVAAFASMRRILSGSLTPIDALSSLVPMWFAIERCKATIAMGDDVALVAAFASAFASVALTDTAFAKTRASNAFVSAIVYFLFVTAFARAFAVDSAMVAFRRFCAFALDASASAEEVAGASAFVTVLAFVIAKVIQNAKVIKNANVIDDVGGDASEVKALVLSFCALGVAFALASARATAERRAHPRAIAAMAFASVIASEMLYRAMTFRGHRTFSWNMVGGATAFAAAAAPSTSFFALASYWIVTFVIAIIAVVVTRRTMKRTIRRKIFHVLVVAMFAPVLVERADLLRVAFAAAFAIFAAVEFARVCDMCYCSGHLGRTITAMYADVSANASTTAPKLVLDHFSLLLGVAIPVWLSDASSHSLTPWSGLLTLGIGDTFAAVIGSTLGKHHAFGASSPKTIEGSLAFATSTFIASLCVGADVSLTRLATACTMTAMCELVCDGVDNFVLPLYFAALVR